MRKRKAAHLLERTVIFRANNRFRWNGCGGISGTTDALVASWYTGGDTEPAPENHVVWSRSLDGGHTWSPPEAIADPPGLVRAGDPVLWRDHGGIINITYGINDMRLDAGDWTFVRHTCVDPAAAELAWSAPEEIAVSDIGDFFFNNKPIRLDNGEWLIPVTVRTRPSQGRPYHEGFYAVGALISSDAGNTWKGFKSGDFEKSGYGPKDICVHEAGAFQRQDGTVVIFVRNSWGLLHATESSDRGRTWSEFYATAIANPSTRFHVRKLPQGPVICLNNPNASLMGESRDRRSPLAMHISYDDGHTFERLVILDVYGHTMYPDAELDPDGSRLHILYENRKDVFYASLELADVL